MRDSQVWLRVFVPLLSLYFNANKVWPIVCSARFLPEFDFALCEIFENQRFKNSSFGLVDIKRCLLAAT